MNKDLRKEQIPLLRFEKMLAEQAKRKVSGKTVSRAAVTAGVVSLVTAGTAAAAKLGSDAPIEAYTAVQAALPETGEISSEVLLSLAEIVGKGHALVEKLAIDASFRLLEAGGGIEKIHPLELVRSILNL